MGAGLSSNCFQIQCKSGVQPINTKMNLNIMTKTSVVRNDDHSVFPEIVSERFQNFKIELQRLV